MSYSAPSRARLALRGHALPSVARRGAQPYIAVRLPPRCRATTNAAAAVVALSEELNSGKDSTRPEKTPALSAHTHRPETDRHLAGAAAFATGTGRSSVAARNSLSYLSRRDERALVRAAKLLP